MKIRLTRLISPSLRTFGFSVAALVASHSAHAASASWLGSTDTTWSGTGNWSATPVPGTGNAATFFGAGNGNTTIDLGSGVQVGAIIYDTASVAAYTIGSGAVGSQTLTLDNSGTITINSTVTNNQLINAALTLGTAAVGTTTITNSSTTTTLTFAGPISGGTGGTAGAKTINVGSSGTAMGSVNFTNSFSAGGSTGLTLSINGTGTATLSGSGTSNFSVLRNQGSGVLVVNGQTVNVSGASGFGTSASIFEIKSGTVNFNGGITSASTSSDAGLWKVTGGSFNAASVTVARNSTASTLPTTTSTTSGLVVAGGVANISGIFSIGTVNSGAQSLVNGGSLTVGGEVRIGAGTSSTRWNVLEVRNGSLVSTDTTSGIILSRAGSAAQNSELLLTGGTTTAEKITFGSASTFAGSTGVVTLNGSAAALYLGSGGMVNAGGSNLTSTVTLAQGTLGAKASWSSTLAMSLTGVTSGAGLTIKAADASNVAQNITLTGALSGTGGFTKTGGGTLTLGGVNTYTGATVVSAGTLLVNGYISSAATVNGGIFAGTGTTGSVAVNTAGTLAAGNGGIGTITTGALSLSGTATFAVDINTTTLASDSVNSGSFSLDAANTVKLSLTDLGGNAVVALGTTFTILTYSGVWDNHLLSYNGSALADDSIFTFGSNNYQISYDGVGGGGNSITLTTVVPEPSTVALIGIGLAGVLWRSRRGSSAGSRA